MFKTSVHILLAETCQKSIQEVYIYMFKTCIHQDIKYNVYGTCAYGGVGALGLIWRGALGRPTADILEAEGRVNWGLGMFPRFPLRRNCCCKLPSETGGV